APPAPNGGDPSGTGFRCKVPSRRRLLPEPVAPARRDAARTGRRAEIAAERAGNALDPVRSAQTGGRLRRTEGEIADPAFCQRAGAGVADAERIDLPVGAVGLPPAALGAHVEIDAGQVLHIALS